VMKSTQLPMKVKDVIGNAEGRILPPLILWMLGVPGIIVIGLWVVFFRS